MNNPKKHHLVPECYLKEFSSSNSKLLQIYDKIDMKQKPQKTPAQVCYEIDAFRIRNQDTLMFGKIEDEYIVEKSFFKKIENNYPKIVAKIKTTLGRTLNLNRQEAVDFLNLFLSIKKRSENFRKSMLDKKDIEYYLTKNIKEMMPVIRQITEKLGQNEDLENSIEIIKKNVLTNEEKLYDAYLMSIGNTKVLDKLIEFLMNFKWLVISAPVDCQFITSDNPGFNYNELKGVSNFGGFGDDFNFIFPITPLHCLFISNAYLDKTFPDNKALHFYEGAKDVVININTLTFQTAKKKIFAYSYNAIENIL